MDAKLPMEHSNELVAIGLPCAPANGGCDSPKLTEILRRFDLNQCTGSRRASLIDIALLRFTHSNESPSFENAGLLRALTDHNYRLLRYGQFDGSSEELQIRSETNATDLREDYRSDRRCLRQIPQS